jgi:aspartyl-tRNA(Asn)/glutamyl-tRNA(Gln) amidotransferase subunit C
MEKIMTEQLVSTIEKMAYLSRIAITEEEKLAFANSLSSVINYFDVLNTFDVSDEEPLYSVLDDLTLPLREDQIESTLSKDSFLKNAPSSVGGLIKVPQVLKQ